MLKNLLVILFLICANFCKAQSGLFDPSFGNKGIVKTDIGFPANYSSHGNQVIVDSDSSLYLIYESTGLTLITRDHPDGTPDISYGNNGSSTALPIYGTHGVLQTDGKLVLLGYSLTQHVIYADYSDFEIARFKTDGTLDSIFGINGIQSTNFKDTDYPISVTIQSDGKILCWGNTYYGSGGAFMAVSRYNTDGTLDNTFGQGGLLISNARSFSFINSLALQNNEKILVVGRTLEGMLGLVRFNGDGSLDSTFGIQGAKNIDFGLNSGSNTITVQSDGKILLAGFSEAPTNNFVLARYNPDGSVDSTLDDDGLQNTLFQVNSLYLESNGNILIQGDTNIALYRNDGSLDETFGQDGLVTPPFKCNVLQTNSDGKFLGFGFSTNGSNFNVVAVRYNANGTPDNTFSFDGSLTSNIKQGSTFYTCVDVQNDNKAIAAGYTWNGTRYDFALVRYTANGSLDTSFSGDGIQITHLDTSESKINAIRLQADGKILVAGSVGNDFGIARYNSNGSLDASFDRDGMLTTNLGGIDSIVSLTVQSDGKILAGGTAIVRYKVDGSIDSTFAINGKLVDYSVDDFAVQADNAIVIVGNSGGYSYVVRYTKDGLLDSTFGFEGRYYNGLYDETPGTSIVIQSDGKILIGGYWQLRYHGYGASFYLYRLNSDGSKDNEFNGGNTIFTQATSLSFATSISIQDDNKIILGGYSYDGISENFTLERFNTTGSLDVTFNGSGIAITPTSVADDRLASIAIKNNKLYGAGVGKYPGNFGVVARYLLDPEGGPLNSTFVTITNGNWAEPTTWDGGIVPNATSEVIVRHKVLINTNVSCYSLKVESPAGNLIVSTGSSLTISH